MAGISRPFFACDRQNQRRFGKKVKKPQRLAISRCKKPGSVSKPVRLARHDIERRWIA
jgi:hypothetical protein